MSSYPAMDREVAGRLFRALELDPTCLIPEHNVETRGSGPAGRACSVSDFQEFLDRWQKLLVADKHGREEIEGRLAVPLYDLLSAAPADAIADIAYWRWVAAVPMRQFVLWRGAKEKGLPSSSAFAQSAERHSALVESVPFRMFLRGQLATVASTMDKRVDREVLAGLGGHDTWMSHILRGGTGRFPLYAAAFLEISEGRTVPIVRSAAKHVNRIGAQVSRFAMDLDEAREAVREAYRLAEQDGEGS